MADKLEGEERFYEIDSCEGSVPKTDKRNFEK